MKIDVYEQLIDEVLEYNYLSSYAISKKLKKNWFIIFGTLCVMALEGKIDYIRTNKNYLFKKREANI